MDGKKKRRYPYDFASLAGLAAILLVAALSLSQVLERFELRTHDLRFRLRGPRATRARIVIAEVDSAALDQWKGPMAGWGAHWAEAIHTARKAGARVVGLDVELPVRMDDYLAAAAEEAYRIAALPETQRIQAGARFANSPVLTPDWQLEREIQADPKSLILGHVLASPLKSEFRQFGVGSGLTNTAAPLDDAVRTMLQSLAGEQTFAAALAAKSAPMNAPSPSLANSNLFWINYVDTVPDRSFYRIPILRLAQGSISQLDRDRLKGATVIIGVRDRSYNDLARPPGGRAVEMTGPEINAHAVATLVDGRPLRRMGYPAETVITLVFGIAVGLWTLTQRFWKSMVGVIAAGLAWELFCVAQFSIRDALLPMTWPAIALAAPFAVCHIVRAAAERRNRMRLELVFGPYIAPRIREFLLASPIHRQPGGLEGEATVMFFDIRDSTPFAERRSPAQVISELNTLFEKIVPEVLARDGLILRYTGDGFLAVFGAPAPMEDHASAAVEAALGIEVSIQALNKDRRRNEQDAWRFGCGIHTGRLVYGNLGTKDRPEFTIIGDTVNLAARLQEACKELGCDIVVSETSWRGAGCPPAAGPDMYRAKGRKEPVGVYLMSNTEVDRVAAQARSMEEETAR